MIYCIFAFILLGLLIGKIKIFRVGIGLSGVLILSLLFGFLIGKHTISFDESMASTCNFLSTFGMVLFIAIIGIQSGEAFAWPIRKKQWKAFGGGIGVVLIGAACLICCGWFDQEISCDLLLGIFAGSMTNTPAMSAALDVYGIESCVAIGYGISYCIGLLSIVLFVQLFCLPYAYSVDRNVKSKALSSAVDTMNQLSQNDSLIIIAMIVLIGMLLSLILPIGNTGGVLAVGVFIGFLIRKHRKKLYELTAYKTLGLILFFIGNGITAGWRLQGSISWLCVLYRAFCCPNAGRKG